MNNHNMVTKANALVTAKYSMSVEEQRIILTLISLVQPDDEDFKPYEFKIAEFIALLGIQDKSKYTVIPKITENLMKKFSKSGKAIHFYKSHGYRVQDMILDWEQ